MLKFVFVVCVCLFVETYSSVFYQPPVDPPAEFAGQPGCYSETFKKMLQVDEAFSPQDGKICEQHTCLGDGYTEVFVCVFESQPDCVQSDGLPGPYPVCCPQYTCPPLTV